MDNKKIQHSPICTPRQLSNALSSSHILLLHCSSAATPVYSGPHLPNSLHLSLARISSLFALKSMLQAAGGSPTEGMVVCYELEGLETCSQVWWLLQVIGYENAVVLEGGLAFWKSQGFSVEEGNLQDMEVGGETIGSGDYDKNRYKTALEIREITSSSKRTYQLLDTEASHKGAINFPSTLILTSPAFLSNPEDIKLMLASSGLAYLPDTPTIVFGLGATVVLLALASIGMKNLCMGVVNRIQEEEDMFGTYKSIQVNYKTGESIGTQFYSVSGDTVFYDALEEPDPITLQPKEKLSGSAPFKSKAGSVYKPPRKSKRTPDESQPACASCRVF